MADIMSIFPLFCLPIEVIKNVLKCMNALEIITFSFTSRASKSLVISINLKVCEMVINVAEKFFITMAITPCWTHSLDWKLSKLKAKRLRASEFNGLTSYLVKRKWRNNGVRDLLKHLMEVTNRRILDDVTFNQTSLNIGSVAQVLEGIKIEKLIIAEECNCAEKALEKIRAYQIKVEINAQNRRGLKIHKILIQNLDSVSSEGGSEEPGSLTLNDLLVMNTRSFSINGAAVPMINRFLKLWKRGANPNLEHFSVVFDRGVEPMELLKGIDFMETEGKWDIWGLGGKKASVHIDGCYVKVYIQN